MANPESIDYFIKFAQQSTDYSWRAPLKSGEAK
jgi:hypothetical protein